MTIARSRRAIGRMLTAAAVLLVVAGAASAGALYYYQASLTPPGSNETVVKAPQAPAGSTSSTATSTSSAAETSTSELASSTACANGTSLLNNTGALATFASAGMSLSTLNYTANDLFGNFSAMAVSTQGSINGTSYGLSDSYNVVGRPIINSVKYYEVNFNNIMLGVNINQTAVFAPDGNATSITAAPPVGDLNGSSAAAEGQALVSTFIYELQTGTYAKAIMSSGTAAGFKVLNETTVSLGPTSVSVTYYTPVTLPISRCGDSITNEVLGLGTAPGTSIPLALYIDIGASEQGTAVGVVQTITSLAVASP